MMVVVMLRVKKEGFRCEFVRVVVTAQDTTPAAGGTCVAIQTCVSITIINPGIIALIT